MKILHLWSTTEVSSGQDAPRRVRLDIRLNYFNGKGCQALAEAAQSSGGRVTILEGLKKHVDVALGDMDWWWMGSAVAKVKLHEFGALFHPKWPHESVTVPLHTHCLFWCGFWALAESFWNHPCPTCLLCISCAVNLLLGSADTVPTSLNFTYPEAEHHKCSPGLSPAASPASHSQHHLEIRAALQPCRGWDGWNCFRWFVPTVCHLSQVNRHWKCVHGKPPHKE